MPPARSTAKAFTDRPASAASFASQSGSSTASTDSEASPNLEPALLAQKRRRIRKKITDAQLAALEETFARNSHPSLQERETLGDAMEMDARSVTTWFQNRRQTIRKNAIHEAVNSENNVLTSIDDALRMAESPDSLDSLGSLPPQNPVQKELPDAPSHGHSPFTSVLAVPINRATFAPAAASPLRKSSSPANISLQVPSDPDDDTLRAAMALAQLAHTSSS